MASEASLQTKVALPSDDRVAELRESLDEIRDRVRLAVRRPTICPINSMNNSLMRSDKKLGSE